MVLKAFQADVVVTRGIFFIVEEVNQQSSETWKLLASTTGRNETVPPTLGEFPCRSVWSALTFTLRETDSVLQDLFLAFAWLPFFQSHSAVALRTNS